MSTKLDLYRPNPSTFQGIRRQIIESGIDPDHINNQWVEVAIAATAKWLSTTEEGARVFSSLMGFRTTKGMEDKEFIYYPEENDTGPTELPIKPSDITFFQGITINGLPAKITQLEVKDKKEDNCEDCGIMSHCTQVILDPYTDQLMRLCNNCVVNNENSKVYDQGDRDGCRACTKLNCPNHTERSRRFG